MQLMRKLGTSLVYVYGHRFEITHSWVLPDALEEHLRRWHQGLHSPVPNAARAQETRPSAYPVKSGLPIRVLPIVHEFEQGGRRQAVSTYLAVHEKEVVQYTAFHSHIPPHGRRWEVNLLHDRDQIRLPFTCDMLLHQQKYDRLFAR